MYSGSKSMIRIKNTYNLNGDFLKNHCNYNHLLLESCRIYNNSIKTVVIMNILELLRLECKKNLKCFFSFKQDLMLFQCNLSRYNRFILLHMCYILILQ